MSSTKIHQRIENILQSLQPFWELANCHMVCYFTDRHWERLVPERLRNEIPDGRSAQECIERLFLKASSAKKDAVNCKFLEFAKFVKQCEEMRLDKFDDLVTSKEALKEILQLDNCKPHLSIKDFMTEKKSHEVEKTARLIYDLVENYKRTNTAGEVVIVDAGDGKGYLSTRLSLQYGYKVLGIDCNQSNTQKALERKKKLQRAWNGLKERAELINRGLTFTRRGKTSKDKILISQDNIGTYNTTPQFISPNLNISQLVANTFEHSENATICLTGLHTCGNLAPTCLEMFHSQAECKILCNIGCCYHLLKEKFCDDGHFGSNVFGVADTSTTTGFPMSTFLKHKSIKLGRNARMLASQSLQRARAAENPINKSLFYRALLEVLISEKYADKRGKIQVGKVRKFTNFAEYVQLCCKKHNLETFSKDEIAGVQKRYTHEEKIMELFYLFRMLFASIVETLILLDRLLYLKEMGYQKSFIISVFDEVVSPRHFGLIAFKDEHSNEC